MAGTTTIRYIGGDRPSDSRLARAKDGWLYVVVTNNEWDSAAAVSRRRRWGVALDREQLDDVAHSAWPDRVKRAGLDPIFDRDGAYAFVHRD